MKNRIVTLYDMEASAIEPMEGYDSVNFKVETDKGTFVLKKYTNEKQICELLDTEDFILNLLQDSADQDFPRTIRSKKGKLYEVENNSIYRLLTYVEGDFLGDVTHTDALLRSFGTFLGRMDKTIHQVDNAPILAKETQWDLRYFKTNYKYLNYIRDRKDRSLVDYFFLQFDEQIYPLQHSLRKATIHNDANDWNVLTTNGKVSGIIDFGDMCHSWLINEVAIAITYVMMNKENPLQIASEVIKGYHEVFPLEELELEVLYYLVAARLCTSVCNSAYSQTIKPDSDYIKISEKPAWQLLRKWLTINPLRAKDCFRKAVGIPISTKTKALDLIERRKSHLSGALSLSYNRPITMSRSAFQYMYDAEGNTILDAYNNIMLTGHCHPAVVRAGQSTMARLNTNTRYLYDELLTYSEKLLSKFPARLNKVFFVNSGSAASDLAIRLAINHTKKQKIMVLEHGYHGNTKIAMDISAYKYNQKAGPGRSGHILETQMPKVFGSGFINDGTAGTHFANGALAQIQENKNKIAAFIAEPIVGCGGQVPLAKGYLKSVYPKIREQGGVCISDEVQVGFGRLGDYFWGFEMHDVEPDLVILGKPMGNGHPIGAVVTTDEIANSFGNGPEFFSSFGGNPVSCAIGQAVLETIEKEDLQHHAKQTGKHLINELLSLQKEFPQIADIRGAGLFIGVELFDDSHRPNSKLASIIKNGLREKNILIGTDGPFDSVLKIKPPLYFNNHDSDVLVATIESLLVRSQEINT